MLPVLCSAVTGEAAEARGRHSPEQSICGRVGALKLGDKTSEATEYVCAGSIYGEPAVPQNRKDNHTDSASSSKGLFRILPKIIRNLTPFSSSSCPNHPPQPTHPKSPSASQCRTQGSRSSLLLRGAPGTQDISLLLPLPASSFTQGEKERNKKTKSLSPSSPLSPAHTASSSQCLTQRGKGWGVGLEKL